jgi:hypothetical protein
MPIGREIQFSPSQYLTSPRWAEVAPMYRTTLFLLLGIQQLLSVAIYTVEDISKKAD